MFNVYTAIFASYDVYIIFIYIKCSFCALEIFHLRIRTEYIQMQSKRTTLCVLHSVLCITDCIMMCIICLTYTYMHVRTS